jgi:1,2-diacylglycerol 3-beta-galactosyltransferase
MGKITIVFFDAGGGHRNAATALKSVIEQQQRPWELELLNLQELLDRIDPLQKVAHIRLQDGYNLLLRKGWTRVTPQLLKLLHSAIRIWHQPTVRVLEEYWGRSRPDLVLSVIPNFNRALAESIRNALAETAFVTLITDFADHPPHFWIECESQYVICGTTRALHQARAITRNPANCFPVSGMVLHPRFYETPVLDRAEERTKLGLHRSLPTALVLFGAQGSSAMLHIAESLQSSPTPLQMIFICGRNERLAERIRAVRGTKPMLVEGFTDQMDQYMSLSDFFIGKPGPGSLSEALHFRLPVIVERNAKTMPQERYNTDWVKEHKAGIVLTSFDDIDAAVSKLLSDGNLERLRANVASHQNQAVFEVIDILARLMPPENLSDSVEQMKAVLN